MRSYFSIARPDHWFKNVFMLPGIALGYWFSHPIFSIDLLLNVLLAIFSICLIASANYTINEWLDAGFDKFHPVKKNRPSVLGKVTSQGVYLQWFILSVCGVYLASLVNYNFLLITLLFLAMGIVYNVKPIRSKDRVYLDVLTESINNPLRLILGVFAIAPDVVPPSSVVISYWMGGAYLMAIKRYSEYRFINDKELASLYRRSFEKYSEKSLLLSAFFYALTAAFFLGIFLVKYRVEFILVFPFLALLFVWYLWIGMQADSVTQNPEKLYKEYGFLIYILFVFFLVILLLLIDIPWLNILLEVRYNNI